MILFQLRKAKKAISEYDRAINTAQVIFNRYARILTFIGRFSDSTFESSFVSSTNGCQNIQTFSDKSLVSV